MTTAEEHFAREFKKTLATLPVQPSILDMPNVLGDPIIPMGKEYYIRNIVDAVFSPLNGEMVIEMGSIIPELSVFDKAGKRKKDVSGDTLKTRPSTPSGSIFIRSAKKLNIPFKYLDQETSFAYADSWVGAPDGRKYIYAVPKSNLFRVNLTALAVSTKKLKAFYGHTFKTWHYGQITVAVIPYNANAKYSNTRILKVGFGVDYDVDIKKYVNGLILKGIVPDVGNYAVDGGLTNLVFGTITPEYDDYVQESILALSEEKAITYDQATELLVE